MQTAVVIIDSKETDHRAQMWLGKQLCDRHGWPRPDTWPHGSRAGDIGVIEGIAGELAIRQRLRLLAYAGSLARREP